jgi:hypothetical protein
MELGISIWNILPKTKIRQLMTSKLGSACRWLHAGFLVGFFFNPENGGDMFLRNVSRFSTNYTALYPRRQKSSISVKTQSNCVQNGVCSWCMFRLWQHSPRIWLSGKNSWQRDREYWLLFQLQWH